jgi:transposase
VQHYIGVDLHKASFHACAVDERGARCWEDRFPRTELGIAAFLTRCSTDVALAVEASGPTWSFADRLVGTVGRLHVVDAARTRLKAGYAAKTDRLDARRLADALRRDSIVGIYYPPVAIRDLRELCRYRISLARGRAALKQRMHALLLRQGVELPAVADLFGQRGRRWLEALTLPGWAGESLAGFLGLFDRFTAELERIQGAVEAQAAGDPIVGALQTLPGIGPVLGVTIRAEIGVIERFPDAPHLASYAGLVPRVDNSGRRVRYGPLTKRGSTWLRWALTEAATHGVRRDDAVGRWARRLAVQKGILKARPAIARALCADILRVWPRTV